MLRLAVFVAAAPLAIALVACAGPLDAGEAQFAAGRYPEAKATFAALEGDSRGWNDARRAEYALYRGLTLGALGDRPQAVVWLRDARAIDEAHPGSLTPDAQRRLKIGLASAEGE